MHAEMSSLLVSGIVTKRDLGHLLHKKTISNRINLSRATLYIARYKYHNNELYFGDAMPCLLCATILQKLHIRKVVYTIDSINSKNRFQYVSKNINDIIRYSKITVGQRRSQL